MLFECLLKGKSQRHVRRDEVRLQLRFQKQLLLGQPISEVRRLGFEILISMDKNLDG